ncbi:MAG: DUF4397 domain-containing protein [Alphaproteobacteria bacterium]|nr:DUF4397 domain-containing protein [Alphaproteobacteria bacterium]
MKIFVAVSFLVFAVMAPVGAMANANADAGLYDPVAPEGSAFVRYANATPMDGSEKAVANGKTYDYLDYQEISPYFVVPGGTATLQIGEAKQSFDVEAGNFYTVVLHDGTRLSLHQDETSDNRAKAQVNLYNYSPAESASLKTSDGNITIIENVEQGGNAAREINPVKVAIAVFDQDSQLKDIGSVALERSESYTAFVFPNREIKWVRAATNTTR